jgi:hypothetical protein
MYLTLIELGIQFLLPFILGRRGGKAPAELSQPYRRPLTG